MVEVARLVGELRPRYLMLENVAALLSRGLGDVLGDLAEVGYDCEWHCIPASAIGAPHRRDRWWAVAYPTANQQLAASIPALLNEARRLHPRGQWSLGTQVAADHVHGNRMWPTPVAHEARLGYQDRSRGKKGTQESLTTVVVNSLGGRDAVSGSLNPDWSSG